MDKKYLGFTHLRGIALGVVDRDNTHFFLYGQARQDQIFEIASITKTFTATLLAEEVADGKIKLSDPIPDEYQKAGAPMTYQHLATHTSGIIGGNFPTYESPNPESPYQGLNNALLKVFYGRTPLAHPVGTHWEYSNIGTGVLGLVLAERSGSSYNDLVMNRIFKPLGMTDSYFNVPTDQLRRFPRGNMNGNPWPHWDLYDTGVSPAGAIRSTIGDMAIYARANLIPESTPLRLAVERAQQPIYEIGEGRWIGMNWLLEPAESLIWHNGSTFCFNSILAISTKYNVAVVAMTDTGFYTTDESGQDVQDTSLQDAVFYCLR